MTETLCNICYGSDTEMNIQANPRTVVHTLYIEI